MCLAVPAKIVSVEQNVATCRVGEGDTFIKASLMLMEKSAQPGDYIIIHAGFALRKLDVEEAEETIRLFREMMALANDPNLDPRDLDSCL